MLQSMREVAYTNAFDNKNGQFFLAGDIGGTNTSFGIFDVTRADITLLFSFHFKSHMVHDYTQLCVELMAYIKQVYGITFSTACFGIAGIVSSHRDSARPTNLSVTVDALSIKKNTGIADVVFMNDFETVGCGIDYIDQKDIVTIHEGEPRPKAHKACIGAGTGMGKCMLVWHEHIQRYVPYASEGGHAECTGQTPFDYNLFAFIRQEKNNTMMVSWEDVLSGRGIQRLYAFLGTTKKYVVTDVTEIIKTESFQPDKISLYAQEDPRCYDTMLLYTKLYARCAKNFALDALALNGLYIAGGIATHNVHLFTSTLFFDEFVAGNRLSDVLSKVPLFVIADYNINLYGAVIALQLYEQKVIV
ncbi:MAG: glucokinase [Candidatus Babeliaceae bacterium]|jgi:glucokinase